MSDQASSIPAESPRELTVVVLGTGTGIGKTYFTSALARALALTHPDACVAALKPIETGLASGEVSDAETLARACVHVKPPAEHPLYGFSPPVSPHLAARQRGLDIQSSAVALWLQSYQAAVRAVSASREKFFLVESAGASFSPLSSDETNFDLARRLDPSVWILVAPDSLGVLHDLTTTLALMRERGRRPDYVVLNQARPPDASTGTNADELRRLRIAQPEIVVSRGSADLVKFAERLAPRT